MAKRLTKAQRDAIRHVRATLAPTPAQAVAAIAHLLAQHQINKKFVIETHSDFMIDRFRIKAREYNADNNRVQLFSPPEIICKRIGSGLADNW